LNYPDDINGNVLRRMQASNFDFTKPHDVEFFAVFRTEEAAASVAKEYVADRKAGDRIVNIETRPAESGGMELELVKHMIVTHEAVTEFEQRLAERVARHDGYLDCWGVFQHDS
jgi:hypothetical protein